MNDPASAMQAFAESTKAGIHRILNSNFRDFKSLSPSLFPEDEFDDNEARELCALCESIVANGYEVFGTLAKTEKGRVLLDTAAGYGHFVEGAIGSAYLGVFIAAELNMEPFASATFATSMYRGECFHDADSGTQQLAVMLIHAARILRGVDQEAERCRIVCLELCCFEGVDKMIEAVGDPNLKSWLKSAKEDVKFGK
ncbi:MAG: hypothetical protein ACOX9C_04605 [Kiritimatiellia bacterium]|uniref:hypothetical protein n=1 Tax=Atribacter sp. TaxID=2847780 RepID=UPI003D99F825